MILFNYNPVKYLKFCCLFKIRFLLLLDSVDSVFAPTATAIHVKIRQDLFLIMKLSTSYPNWIFKFTLYDNGSGTKKRALIANTGRGVARILFRGWNILRGRLHERSGGGDPWRRKNFENLQKFPLKIAKMHHFCIFYTKFYKPYVNFCAFGRTQFFGNFEKNSIFWKFWEILKIFL